MSQNLSVSDKSEVFSIILVARGVSVKPDVGQTANALSKTLNGSLRASCQCHQKASQSKIKAFLESASEIPAETTA